jgi:RHS repeat-associated protein
VISTKVNYYTYDHVGRRLKYLYSLNGNLKTIAKYQYDAIGRMTQKLYAPSDAIGSNQTGLWTNLSTWQGANIPTIADQVTINQGHTVTIPTGQTMQAGTLFNKGTLQNFGILQMGTLAGSNTGTLQTLNYKYHIRGGLKGINLDANNNLMNSLFSYKLDYEDDGTYFDGNIRKQTWKSNLDNTTRSYTYGYDGGSRIESGIYASTQTNENYSLNSVSYDGNGNILTLSRNGFKSNSTFGLVDNLVYGYSTNSNKILKVDDLSNETASFEDVAGNDYSYSLDGSLTSDANKGISVIEYNYLKLPRRIVKGAVTILYQYDTSGKKLKETIGSQVTDYVGNLIYKNGVLYQLGHDEGRIINGEYEYHIKDHLGNLRVAFRDSLGIAKIVQANSYGIWGEELPTLSYLKPTWKEDKFKFTGKEELPETGYTDFGARLYDKFVPRFISVDPMAEQWNFVSPYTYTLNNPLRFIDPDGNGPILPPVLHKQINLAAQELHKFIKKNNAQASRMVSMYERTSGQKMSFIDKATFYASTYLSSGAGNMTDANDVSVLAGGRNIDGSKASYLDRGMASIGIFLPVVSGSMFKNMFENAGEIGAKILSKQDNARALAFSIDNGSIKGLESGTYDFVITTEGELKIGSGHFGLADEASTVKGAGEIYIDAEGKVQMVNNNSGHYQPNSQQLLMQAKLLKAAGLVGDDFHAVNVK